MESKKARRTKLIEEAIELDQEVSFIEYRLRDIVSEIEALEPTKKELSEGVQELIDCYGS